MRCPHCGGLNPDNLHYCIRCGRNFAPQQQALYQSKPPDQSQSSYPPPQNPQRSVYPPTQNPQRTVYPPTQNTPYQPQPQPQPQQRPVAPQARPAVAPKPPQRPGRPATRIQESNWHVEPVVPTADEPPAVFPPKTIAQLKQLEPGALDYTLINDEGGYGKKKIVRIEFRRCVPWQQVATLLRAFNEYDASKFDTVIIQAIHSQEAREIYEYTNGQLIFDRNVRLGSQTLNRFRIETDNGYSTEALRIVLSE
jgi:hypothetical protein